MSARLTWRKDAPKFELPQPTYQVKGVCPICHQSIASNFRDEGQKEVVLRCQPCNLKVKVQVDWGRG